MRLIMQIFYQLLYHNLAWTYDLVSAMVSIGRWKDWIHAAMPHLHGERILELGFGPGHLQVALARQGTQPFGLDESSQMARQAYRRLNREHLPAALMQGYAQHLPFPTIHSIA